MPSVKPKPCPFCGGTPEVITGGFRPDPGASGGICDTKKEAVAAWNRRANDD